jgi:hypothetical protein
MKKNISCLTDEIVVVGSDRKSAQNRVTLSHWNQKCYGFLALLSGK